MPIKFIAHYKSLTGENRQPIDWAKAYNDLKQYGDSTLPIHALEEGDYIVINT